MSSKTRLWALVTGAFCVLIVLYGLFAGLAPQLTEASRIRGEAEDAQILVEAQSLQLSRLQVADEEIDALREELGELEAALPTTRDWARFLLELARLQADTGATVTQFASFASVETGTVETEADAAAGATEVDGDGGADTADATAIPVDEAPSAGARLVEIPISITAIGNAEQVNQFFQLLQTGERVVTARSLSISGSGDAFSGTLDGAIYVVP